MLRAVARWLERKLNKINKQRAEDAKWRDRWIPLAASNGPPLAEAMGWCEPTNYNTGLYHKPGRHELFRKTEAGEYIPVKTMSLQELVQKADDTRNR